MRIGKLAYVNAETLLKTYQKLVDRRLDELLPPISVRPARLHEAMRYSCLASGKRIRPALCLASCEASGGSPVAALDLAAALEMIHVFSLIHDDLPAIDDDDLRRGNATCHKKFGEAIAILAGDALFALGFETIANSYLGAEEKCMCLRIVAEASGSNGLVGGEVVDVESERLPIDAETLEWIHSRKTGALIAASCVIGGIAGGASESQIACLNRFGQLIGTAFQITDDVLNETGDAAALGKSVGSDQMREKATYPRLFGLEESKQAAIRMTELAEAELNSEFENASALLTLARYSIERIY